MVEPEPEPKPEGCDCWACTGKPAPERSNWTYTNFQAQNVRP